MKTNMSFNWGIWLQCKGHKNELNLVNSLDWGTIKDFVNVEFSVKSWGWGTIRICTVCSLSIETLL